MSKNIYFNEIEITGAFELGISIGGATANVFEMNGGESYIRSVAWIDGTTRIERHTEGSVEDWNAMCDATNPFNTGDAAKCRAAIECATERGFAGTDEFRI